MAEKESKKKGFLGKFFEVITGSPGSTTTPDKEEKGKFAPVEKEPLDVRFVRHFTEAGGFFLYCGDKAELIEALNQISIEHKLMGIGSPDASIVTFLKKNGIANVLPDLNECDTVCTYCEALIAFNGGIMIDEFQTKGFRIDALPKYHIVLGKTSQLVDNLSSAMSKINQLYRDNRPMQISQLRPPGDEQVMLASADPNKGRTLFLLLIEDVTNA